MGKRARKLDLFFPPHLVHLSSPWAGILSLGLIIWMILNNHLVTLNLSSYSWKMGILFSSVQSLSRVWLSAIPWTPAHQASCPSPTARAYPNSCPLNQWCHTTISSSVVPFSSCLQSFPASGFSQMSQLFTSGGQSIGVSASAWSFQWIFRLNSFRIK